MYQVTVIGKDMRKYGVPKLQGVGEKAVIKVAHP